MQPTFSVCIPAYNEEQYLPATIDAIRASANMLGEEVEIIVGDNMSTDRTAEVARERGAKVAPVEKRCISAARNGAAALATGKYLAFVDADVCISEQLLPEIKKAMDTGKFVGGGVAGLRFERSSPGIWLTCKMVDFGMGLAGLSFVVLYTKPEYFKEIGGFDETLLSTEDPAFARAIRRLGRKKGLRYKNLRTATAVMSARKFDQYGDWMVFRSPLKWLRACFNDSKVAEELWYNPKR